MDDFTMIVGDKNYSSWSMRGWLALRATGAPFREIVIPLEGPGKRTHAIDPHSPSGKVPSLRHGSITVWDSLAIGEYLAELFPAAGLWPADREARAVARSVAAEMHSGFSALRAEMPMNIRRQGVTVKPSDACKADVARVIALWNDVRARYGRGGDFLFGAWSLADMAFAPVITRFRSYGVQTSGAAADYVDRVWDAPHVQEWIVAARAESHAIPAVDAL